MSAAVTKMVRMKGSLDDFTRPAATGGRGKDFQSSDHCAPPFGEI
jgi:hypothetical protein